jgi:hypothetical protein
LMKDVVLGHDWRSFLIAAIMGLVKLIHVCHG